jgi:MFS transporter, DHA2 family, multidrug resistance protein
MASGISNTSRIAGLAMGVAALGAILQQHVGARLASEGVHRAGLAEAISSSGLRAAHGDEVLAHAANAAFVSGFRLILLVGAATVFVGSLAAVVLVRRRTPQAAPMPASSG